MQSLLGNFLRRETLERKEKGKMNKPKKSNSLDQNGKHLGRENKEGLSERKMSEKRVSAFASMSDVRQKSAPFDGDESLCKERKM